MTYLHTRQPVTLSPADTDILTEVLLAYTSQEFAAAKRTKHAAIRTYRLRRAERARTLATRLVSESYASTVVDPSQEATS